MVFLLQRQGLEKLQTSNPTTSCFVLASGSVDAGNEWDWSKTGLQEARQRDRDWEALPIQAKGIDREEWHENEEEKGVARTCA